MAFARMTVRRFFGVPAEAVDEVAADWIPPVGRLFELSPYDASIPAVSALPWACRRTLSLAPRLT
jgi:hypothetical protein